MSDSLEKGFLPPPQFPETDQKPRQKVIRWPHLPHWNHPCNHLCRLTLFDLDNGSDNGIGKGISYSFLKNWYSELFCSWSCAVWSGHFLPFVSQLLKNAANHVEDQGTCVDLKKQLIEDGSLKNNWSSTREAMTKPQVLPSVSIVLLQSYCQKKTRFIVKYFYCFVGFGCITFLFGMKDTLMLLRSGENLRLFLWQSEEMHWWSV